MGLFSLDNFFRSRIQRLASEAAGNAYYQSLYRFLNDGQVIYSDEEYRNKDYSDFYRKIGAVYECVDLISKKIAAAPRIVYKIKDEEKYKVYKNLMKSGHIHAKAQAIKMRPNALEEVRVPRIDDLLKKPNPKQNGYEFIRMIAGLYLLRGNAYIYGNGGDNDSKKWSELFALPADMHIVSGGMFEPVKGYILGLNTPSHLEFPAEQVKHIKTFNPYYDSTGSHLYGISPLSAYLYSADKIKNANIQSNTQLKNGGMLGFINPKHKEDQLSDTQKKDLRDKLKQAYRGKGDLDRIIPASIPMDWTEIGLSSADLQLLEISEASADDIYLGYHVPLPFRRTDASSYNNLTTASKQFIYNAVDPIAEVISQALTEFICEPYNTGRDKEVYVIDIDCSSLPELADDMKAVAEWLANSWDLTPNEKREVKGWGKVEAAGMDEIWVPKGFIRMQDVMDGKINSSDRGSQAPYQAGDPNNPVDSR